MSTDRAVEGGPRPSAFRALSLLTAGCLLLVAIRAGTLAPDPWEWDEILYLRAVREGLDLRVNHPHPPGYPLFVELATGATRLGVEPFRALTLVGASGSLLAAGGTAFLLFTLGVPSSYAFFGAVFYAFVPSVWLHGTRPLTDGLGAATFLLAAGLFVRSRGRGSPALFVAGALATALALGVRPQVAMGLAPLGAFAAWPLLRSGRGVRALGVAALVFASATFAIWRPLVAGSGGWQTFRSRLEQQAEYVREFDAPRSRELVAAPVWARWWRDPFGRTELFVAAFAIASLALVGSRSRALAVVAIFAPLIAVSMRLGGPGQAPRYAAATLPALAALVALGLECLASRAGRWPAAALGTALLAGLAWTGFPAVVEVATHESPTVGVARALREEAPFKGRPLVFNGRLHVHLETLVPGVPRRELRAGEPTALAGTELVLASDRPLFGVTPERTFSFSDPMLPRISGTRPLSVFLYDGISGVGIVTARVDGDAAGSAGGMTLGKGGSVELGGAQGPVHVRMRATAEDVDSTLRLETEGESRNVVLRSGSPTPLEISASPSAEERLLRITNLVGRTRLDSFQLSAPPSRLRPMREDNDLPVSVDGPGEGEEVRGELFVRGWCQELGGGRIEPAEFRIDGTRVRPTEVRRVPRPDVAAALPKVGDASSAGYEATFVDLALDEGRHRLTVSFQTPDGRRRTYPARGFVYRK